MLTQSLPKVLLHDHLDGGLRPQTIIDLAKEQDYRGLPTTDAGELAEWFHRGARRGSLPLYLEGFAHTCGVTSEVTPAQPVYHERWYECVMCHRRFAVKFMLLPLQASASEAP